MCEDKINVLLSNEGQQLWIQFGMSDLSWQTQDQTQPWLSKIIEMQSKTLPASWEVPGSKNRSLQSFPNFSVELRIWIITGNDKHSTDFSGPT